jgi:hypothetical protein
MESKISVQVPTQQFIDLVAFLRDRKDPRDPVAVISTAIDYWLDNADWKPELLARVRDDSRGYRWKRLFLPHGTEIRMQYKGRYYYARVDGDEIVYDGQPTSPGNLANTIAGGSRNAWRDLWVKRPDDKVWKLADDCRREIDTSAEKLLHELTDATSAPHAER